MSAELWVSNLGRVPYAEAVALQDRIRAARQDGTLPDVLLLLEHDPVYTKGRRTDPADLPIGEHVSRGVTMHGFAVNVDCDLQPFEWIVPCGIEGVRMTSLYVETQRTGAMWCLRKRVAWRLAQELGLRQRIVTLDRLLAAAG